MTRVFRQDWGITLTLTLALASAPAIADIVVPGANGSDGAFNPTTHVVIDLRLAPTGSWDGPNTSPGNGVYDPEKWAVVFRYSSVNIPSNSTVSFINHTSGAPVVWLVDGDVTIAGHIDLNGMVGSGQQAFLTRPGPGGFPGCRASFTGSPQGRGGGPGGARDAGGGSHATLGAGASGPTYSDDTLIPLIGGSGGVYPGAAGGGGGGAILIAARQSIDVSGTISARGGNTAGQAGGSGGAIRLVAGNVSITGALYADSTSTGGLGRIRLEAATILTPGGAVPEPSIAVPGATATLWPSAAEPTARVLSVDGVEVPLDPRPRENAIPDVSLDLLNPVQVLIETLNVPSNWQVRLRVVPDSGPDIVADASFVSGNMALSTWQVSVNLPVGRSAVQVRASAP